MHCLDDRILGEETRKPGKPDQCQRAEQSGPMRDRHVLADTPHTADVLFVMHPDDHRPGGEEQQGLEKGMRHQVEQPGGIGRCTQRSNHVAELRQRRVGHDPLDVVLHDADEAHEKGRGRTDDQHESQRGLRKLVER